MRQSYENGYFGASGIAAAVNSLFNGDSQLETFVIADHTTVGKEVYETHTIAFGEIEGIKTLRWCGENKNPIGSGSSAVIPTWAKQDVAEAAAVVAANLTAVTFNHVKDLGMPYPSKSIACIFRQ